MLLLDDLSKVDAYYDGLMERTDRKHARHLKPLVQTLFAAIFGQRKGPPLVRTYKDLTANVAQWTSKATGNTYKIMHRDGDVLIRHGGVTIHTLNATTPLDSICDLIAKL